MHFYCAKQKHIGRILHSHSSQPSGSKIKALINRLFYSLTKPLVTDRIACSRVAGEFLFKNQHYKIIYNAIDCNKFVFKADIRALLRNQFNLSDNTIVLGHIGNFEPVKNHHFLLNLISILAKRTENYKLFLIGVGAGENECKQWVQKHKLQDKVVFLGFRQDVPQLLNIFDLFLLPSFFEGFPLSVLEAQCNGLPNLISDRVTNEVAITDLVQFYSIENIDQWIDAISVMQQNQKREDYAHIMSEKGFSIEHHIQQLMDVYQQVLQRSH